jgi:hypothetical protein
MSGKASGGIASPGDVGVTEGRELAERKTEEQAARWAQALLPHLGPQSLPLPMPEGWRPSDGVLTRPGAEAASGSAGVMGPTPESDASGERVHMSVKTPELGELSVILERSADGVRVVIGVADASKLAQIAGERAALLHQLEQSGVNVQRIDVVSQGEVGTVLAQHKFVGRLRASGVADKASEEEAKQRRRGSRKLNFTG